MPEKSISSEANRVAKEPEIGRPQQAVIAGSLTRVGAISRDGSWFLHTSLVSPLLWQDSPGLQIHDLPFQPPDWPAALDAENGP